MARPSLSRSRRRSRRAERDVTFFPASRACCRVKAAIALAILLLAGCVADPVAPYPLPGVTSGVWTLVSQDDASSRWVTDPAWHDFAAANATFRAETGPVLILGLPLLGNLTIRYMPHGASPEPTWYQVSGGWLCCRNTTVLHGGHGHALMGMRRDATGEEGSSIELAVSPAGVEGVIGLPNAQPEGMARGTYLLRFRIGGEDYGTQSLLIERVHCYDAGDSYDWIYGCGSDPVCEGSVAPMGGGARRECSH